MLSHLQLQFFVEKKPNLNEFFKDFVCELKKLLLNGFKVEIKVRAFCCDTLARAFIKNIVGHNEYAGCDKCHVRGNWQNHRMRFIDGNASLRTDNNFLEKSDPEHHHGDTPLTNLNIGMISSFPLDYMHCVCLEVVRKLLMTWRDNEKIYGLTNAHKSFMDSDINQISTYWPSELNRKPRSILEIDMWKATEFRQFLLYLGPIVLTKNTSSRLLQFYVVQIWNIFTLT